MTLEFQYQSNRPTDQNQSQNLRNEAYNYGQQSSFSAGESKNRSTTEPSHLNFNDPYEGNLGYGSLSLQGSFEAPEYQLTGQQYSGQSKFQTPGKQYSEQPEYQTPGQQYSGQPEYQTPGKQYSGQPEHQTPGQQLPGQYTVQQGDTLWGIASQSLGQNATPNEILQQMQGIITANEQNYPSLASNPDLIYPNMQLAVPKGQSGQEQPAGPTSPGQEQPAGPTSPGSQTSPKAPGANSAGTILGDAQSDIGQKEWTTTSEDRSVCENGEDGCAASVSAVLRQAGVYNGDQTSVQGLQTSLQSQGWTVDKTPQPGDVILAYDGISSGHCGIVGQNGTAFMNASSTGEWTPTTVNYFTSNWREVVYLHPPA